MEKDTFEYAAEYYTSKDDYYTNKPNEIRISKVLKLIGKGKKILDVGCYNGTIGEKILKNGNEVWGLDASKEGVELAKKKGIKAFVGNLENKFPFKDESFDVVFAGEIIEHILDTESFLDEIKRVLKKDGELIITTPNVASLARRIMLLFGLNPFFEASFGFPKNATAGHVRFYTKSLLEDFLRYKGFKIISFNSDVINFTTKISSSFLVNIFPKLGRGLIFRVRK